MPRDTSDPLLPKQDNSVFDSIPRKVMPWSKTQLVAHSLDYPVNMRSLQISGPTVLYIDQNGNLVQAALNDEQKEAVVEILKQTYDVSQ